MHLSKEIRRPLQGQRNESMGEDHRGKPLALKTEPQVTIYLQPWPSTSNLGHTDKA